MSESEQNRNSRKPSHQLADEKELARVIAEIPSQEPLSAVADAAASLQSLELATSFGIGQRLNLVSTLDEAVQSALAQVFGAFLGTQRGQPQGTFRQWQTLREYWMQIATAYEYCAVALAHNPRSGPVERLPLVMVRSMRAHIARMKIEWMRYFVPPETTWAGLIGMYKAAVPLQLVSTPVAPYRGIGDGTSPQQELASAVMLQAAAPLSLQPRQIELASRIASAFSGSMHCGEARGEGLMFRVDLDRPSRPAPAPAQSAPGGVPRFIGAGLAVTKLTGLLQHAKENGTVFLQKRFGEEFSPSEKFEMIEYLVRYWGESPPSRQHERKSLQAGIQVAAGMEPIRNVLAPSETAGAAPMAAALSLDGAGDKPAGKPVFGAMTETWTLTDFSAHGLGARFARRPEGQVKIGTPFIFKLERSPKWCLAVIKRLQADERNNIEVGAQILARAVVLARVDTAGMQSGSAFSLQGESDAGTATAGLSGRVVLLHGDAELKCGASLMLDAGANGSGQVALLRYEDTSQHVKLGEVIDRGEGYERLAFENLAVEN